MPDGFRPSNRGRGAHAQLPVAGGSASTIAVGGTFGAPGGVSRRIRPIVLDALIADHDSASQSTRRYATRGAGPPTHVGVRPHGVGSDANAFYAVGTGIPKSGLSARFHPFDEIEAVHVGSTTYRRDKGAALGAAMVRMHAETYHLVRSELRPKGLHQDALMCSRECICGVGTSCGCRMSGLRILLAAGDYAGRGRTSSSGGRKSLVVVTTTKGSQAWLRKPAQLTPRRQF